MKSEPYLGNPIRCKAVLNKYGFVFRKQYGQNFLIDGTVLDGIVSAAGIGPEDAVLEIGPGIGSLTQYLASAAGSVTAVELDKALLPILADTLSGWDNVRIVPGDILKLDVPALAEEIGGGRPVKVAANLPYYITTPILMKLFESRANFSSITVMVQKEVAERMETGPGSKAYGALSLAVQYYAKPERVLTVPAASFIPRPHVDSAVIRLTCHETPPVTPKSEALLFSLIRASFQQRRKTLANGIANSGEIPCGREAAQAAIETAGLPANVRGETLTLAEFAALSDALYAELNA